MLPPAAGFIAADLFDAQAPEKIATELEADFGRVDGFVSNAAFFSSQPSVTESSDELWRSTFEINVFAPVRLVRALRPLLGRSGGGRSFTSRAKLPDWLTQQLLLMRLPRQRYFHFPNHWLLI